MMLWDQVFIRAAWGCEPSTKGAASQDLYFNNWNSQVNFLEKTLERGHNGWISGEKNSINSSCVRWYF